MKAKIITLIAKMIGNRITGSELSEELLEILFEALAGKVSEKEFEEIKNIFRAGKSATECILTRENMLAANVPEPEVDFVIDEIRCLLSKVEITDELLGRCRYNSMGLGEFLWDKYYEDRKKSGSVECEKGIKNGLFSIAKVWMELRFESPEFEKKCLTRIDIKADQIISQLENMQKDIEQIKDTDRSSEKADGKACGNSDGQESDCAEQASENVPEQEASDAEEILPDEIKIYLAASPDEFRHDIDSLKAFMEEQNNCQNAVRLTLKCDDGNGQDIQECKYCYMLVGSSVEEWMQEVYEQVYKLNPDGACVEEGIQLCLFFRNQPDKETVGTDNGRKKLEDRYKKDFGQMPFYFSDINRIKLDILQNLRSKAPNVKFSTESILQFQNNAAFGEACKKCGLLQNQYENACKIFSVSKSPDTKRRMEKLGVELKAQNEIVKKMERCIWDNINLLADKFQNKAEMDVREAEAIENVIEYGNYSKADNLLRNEEWSREITDLEQSMKDKKRILREFISARRTLISNLKTGDVNSGLEDEITGIYERITEISKEWQIEYVTLFEFAEFLLNQRKYDRGIAVGEHLKCLYGLSDGVLHEDKVRLLKLLGNLYYANTDYVKAEKNYREVLQILEDGFCENQELISEIYNDLAQLLWKTNQLQRAEEIFKDNAETLRRLVTNEPKIYEPILAVTYNHLAILANRKNQLDKALEYHFQATEIRERLAEKSLSYNDEALIKLAGSYNNLGFLYKKMADYQNAEKYYRKSMDIRCRNVKRNPSVYRPLVALAYSNYASFLNLTGNNEEAQDVCKKALDIRRGLAQENPSYEAQLANTLIEYGMIMEDAHRYPQARQYMEEVIEIRKKLARKDRMAHSLSLAKAYRYYGKLLVRMGKVQFNKQFYREAEENFERALKIYYEFSEDNPSYDIDEMAETHQAFAELLERYPQRYPEAEEHYQKAVSQWEALTKQCRRVFEPRLKKAEDALKELQTRIHGKF